MAIHSVNLNKEAVSVVGLEHLGAPLAACFAASGFSVIGIDNSPTVIELMNQNLAPVQEPGLQGLLTKHADKLKASTDISVAATETDITFIIVPTPSLNDGGFDNSYVLDVCRRLAKAIAEKKHPHVVVIASTVMPGSCAGPIAETLERHSGLDIGEGFHLVYNPQFIALGSVIYNILNPDMCLLGESDPVGGHFVAQLHQRVHHNTPFMARMNLVNAELTKLAVNTFVTTKISFANMLARICENTPGADADVVTKALGSDSRIGPTFLKGAIGCGGPCFPRDNKALAVAARNVGVNATIAVTTDHFNKEQTTFLAELTKRHLRDDGRVAILGLAYKPDTDVTAESQGISRALALAEQGFGVHVQDPIAIPTAKAALGDHVTYYANPVYCASSADVVVITTPLEEFHSTPWQSIASNERVLVAIDCWRILDGIDTPSNVFVVQLDKHALQAAPCVTQQC